MKKIVFRVLINLGLLISILMSTQACSWFFYQPEIPVKNNNQ